MSAAALKEELNPFEIAKQELIARPITARWDGSRRNVRRSTKRQLIVSIPVRMDGGETKVFLPNQGKNYFDVCG